MKNLFIILFLLIVSANVYSQEVTTTNNITKLNQSFTTEEAADKNATKPKNFSFSVNPYLWTIAMGGTIGVPGTPVSYPQTYEFNKSFSEALKDLRMAFMIGGKFKYKRVSLYYDVVYANLKTFDATLPQGSGLVSADFTFKELITDLSLGYSFPTTSKSTFIDAYAGARISNVENELTLIDNSSGARTMLSKTTTYVDPIAGIHVNFLLSQKWFSYLRSDLGGFGINSKFSFMIMGGFGYRFSPNFNSTLGIKNLSMNYDKEKTTVNVNQYGLVISVGYAY